MHVRAVKSSGQTVLRLLLVLALLGLGFVFTVMSARDYVEVPELALPSLVGLDYDEAARILTENDLVPISYAENLRNARINEVTSQSPAAGTIVRQGRTVSLGVHTPPQDARAPVLIGLTAEAALALARQQSLNLGQIDYEHNNAPPGIVISQQPEPGSIVDPILGLEMVVSRGPELPPVNMPDLRGLMLDDAEQRLRQMGFMSIVRVATGVSASLPGSVTAQQPAPGQLVERAAPVSLSYALNSSIVIPVPSVIGQPLATAQMRLRAAGLAVGSIGYAPDSGGEPGTVVSVSPPVGSYTLQDAPVRLVLAGTVTDSVPLVTEDPVQVDTPQVPNTPLFPVGELGSRNIPISFDPAQHGIASLMQNSYRLQVEVEDDQGTRTVLERSVPAGEAVSTSVIVYGDDAMVRMYLNDLFYMAWRP